MGVGWKRPEVGKRIRVTVQLVNVATGFVWRRGLMKVHDIFAVEDSISEQVARRLDETEWGREKMLGKRYTENTEAMSIPQGLTSWIRGQPRV